MFVFFVFFLSPQNPEIQWPALNLRNFDFFPCFFFNKQIKFDLFAKSTVFDFLHKEFSKSKRWNKLFKYVFPAKYPIVGKPKVFEFNAGQQD